MLNCLIRKKKLELISDGDIHLFFKKGMRGRVSYNFKKHSKANNDYLKSHDLKQESKYIIYLDAKIYVVMLCLDFFQLADSNGLILKILT